MLAALGGVVLTAQVGRGDVGAGGAVPAGRGGRGAHRARGIRREPCRTPSGPLLGAIFVGVILNGLTMANLPYYAQDLVKGLVLAIALILTFAVSPTARR